LRRLAPEFKVTGEASSSFYVKISLIASISSRVTAIKMLNRLVKEGLLYHEGSIKTSKYFIRKIKT
jgi:hypothetical protein